MQDNETLGVIHDDARLPGMVRATSLYSEEESEYAL